MNRIATGTPPVPQPPIPHRKDDRADGGPIFLELLFQAPKHPRHEPDAPPPSGTELPTGLSAGPFASLPTGLSAVRSTVVADTPDTDKVSKQAPVPGDLPPCTGPAIGPSSVPAAPAGLSADAMPEGEPLLPDMPLPGVPSAPSAGGMPGGQKPGAVALIEARTEAVVQNDPAATVRLFAQHWYGNGYLSLVEQRPQVATGPLWPPETGHSAALAASAADAGMPTGTQPAAPAAASPVPLPVRLECPLDAAHGKDMATLERLARSLGPALAAEQPWPERMLRMILRRDGVVTAWVRDYAMAPGDVPAMVAHLRHQASLHGATLDRVVINGATAWRNPSIQGDG